MGFLARRLATLETRRAVRDRERYLRCCAVWLGLDPVAARAELDSLAASDANVEEWQARIPPDELQELVVIDAICRGAG